MTLLYIEGFEGSGDTNTTLRDFMRKSYPGSSSEADVGFTSAGRINGKAIYSPG